MTQTVGDGHVELELRAGRWSARWPGCGVAAGPFGARVGLSEPREADERGRWEITSGTGGATTLAGWRPDDETGVAIELELGTAPGVVVVRVSCRASRDDVLHRIEPLRGAIDTTFDRRLVNGYDSWSYSGVVAHAAGDSWWNTTLVARGRALGFQSLTARRWCTRIHFESPTAVVVACEGAPDARQVEGTWGFVSEPRDAAVAVEDGEIVQGEPVALGAATDAFALTETLSALAAEAGGARHWPGPPVAGWESWYHYGLFVRADEILDNARLLRRRYDAVDGFDLVQIDDGWQVTYGAWWPNERFPGDLGDLVHDLHGLGCRAGLWLAPFMVQPHAPGVATEHPDWMVTRGGRPTRDRHGRHSLDATNPAARVWLRDLGAQVRAWGVDMVKLDFLYLGAVEGDRADRAVTGTAALRLGLRAFLDGLGDDVYVLGCGMPLLPAVGICHGNRVGHDLAIPVRLREVGQPLAKGWSGFAGIRPQARNVAARWALHHRWFDADPDVVMAWGTDARSTDGYTVEESRTLAVLAALCGGPFLLADDLAALDDAERGVLEHPGLLALTGGDGFRPDDLFEQIDTPDVGHVFEQPSALASTWSASRHGRRVVARFNWTDHDASFPVPAGVGAAHELWTGASASAATTIVVPAHGVRVFVADDPVTPTG